MPPSAGSSTVTTPAGDGPQRRSGHRLPQTARKSMVVVHVVVSVSWLALMLCLFTLGTTALATNNADTLRTAYRAMGMLGNVLIIPLSLLTLVSGVMLALATPWGLFRYYWVSAKFWLTLAATVASICPHCQTPRRGGCGDPASGGPHLSHGSGIHPLQHGDRPGRRAPAVSRQRHLVRLQAMGSTAGRAECRPAVASP